MNPVKLPFDQYQRYRVVKEAIEAVREGDTPCRILDVGGSPGLMLDFLPEDDIFIVDRVISPAGRFIRSDGTSLPFREAAFDIVISVDVLEHIAPVERETFIGELKRVAKNYVFIAAPFRTSAVEEAERILFDVIKAAGGEEHAFLKEHLEYGLPEEAAVMKSLETNGWEALSVPNGALKRWLPMMALSLYMTGEKFLRDITGRINVFYNSNYYSGDNREPSYRHLLASCRGGFKRGVIEKIEGLAATAGQEKDLDLSWLSLFITLFGYRDMKKAHDSEREEFKKVLAARDKHINSLKHTVEKKDERIKRLEVLEKSTSVKALKRLGIIKKPSKT